MGAVADDHHRASGQIRIAFDDPAIVQIAVEHRGFAGIEMPAHGGVDAVGTDQQVSFRFARRLAGRIDEAGKDLVAALLQACELVAGDERPRTQAGMDGREQDVLQLAARDRDLRPVVTRGLAARLGPDQLPMPVVEGEFGGEDARAREFFTQSQRGELAHRIRLQIDPVANRLEPGNRFIDAAVDADLVEAERGRKAGNAATDNDHLHAISCNTHFSSARCSHRE